MSKYDSIRILETGLPVRCVRTLNKLGIGTVGDLRGAAKQGDLTWGKLVSLPMCGDVSQRQIEALARQYGIKLREGTLPADILKRRQEWHSQFFKGTLPSYVPVGEEEGGDERPTNETSSR